MLNKSHGKSKHQNAKFKQIPMTEIQNVPIRRKKSINCLVCIGIWFLGFGYYLEFGILLPYSGKFIVSIRIS